MGWVAVALTAGVAGFCLWCLISLALLLRDYDEIDWGDDEF